MISASNSRPLIGGCRLTGKDDGEEVNQLSFSGRSRFKASHADIINITMP